MTKIHYLLLAAVVVGAVYYFGFRQDETGTRVDSSDTQSLGMPEISSSPVIEVEVKDDQGGDITVGISNVREFTVIGTANMRFSLSEIKVKKGDTVRVIFKNEGGFHDWVIDEFNARTKRISAGQSETIEFVADKVGTFEYYCSVGEHRKAGMKGNLIVQ